MAERGSRRRIGVRRIEPTGVRHVTIFHEPDRYAGHVNRGGIWNFGDGEIAVAHLVRRVDYQTGEWVKFPHTHDYSSMPEAGVMLNRSFDLGETWPADQRQWIWNNDRTLDEIREWLKPAGPKHRDEIDLSETESIIHFGTGEYLKCPFGATGLADWPDIPVERRIHLGVSPNQPSFCLRSRDRGRTWERRATIIEGVEGRGALIANLGHVRFDNGVLAVAGGTVLRDGINTVCLYVSYDDGIQWEFISPIARPSYAPDPVHRYTYLGLHRLPDGLLLCSMHKMPENLPAVVFSEDDGMTWTQPRPIVSPATHPRPRGPAPRRASGTGDPREGDGYDRGEIPRYRSPCALVTSTGRIVIVFATRYPSNGNRGIRGVVSDDLGETWSKEFVIRGDAYCWDCGYPVITELPDGRFFTAYYITVDEGEQPKPAWAAIRHIAGTFFTLEDGD